MPHFDALKKRRNCKKIFSDFQYFPFCFAMTTRVFERIKFKTFGRGPYQDHFFHENLMCRLREIFKIKVKSCDGWMQVRDRATTLAWATLDMNWPPLYMLCITTGTS